MRVRSPSTEFLLDAEKPNLWLAPECPPPLRAAGPCRYKDQRMRRNSAEDIARRSAVDEEKMFLDVATARRDRLAEHLRAELSPDAQGAVELARRRMLRRQYEELSRAQEGLVFGRLDGVDGTVRHLGRVGLRDDDDDG